MKLRSDRLALGGVLAGLALFCGARSALAQVLPGWPPSPPAYLPNSPNPAPPAPPPPPLSPGGAIPVLPGMPQRVPPDALPPMQPTQPMPMGAGTGMGADSPTPMGQSGGMGMGGMGGSESGGAGTGGQAARPAADPDKPKFDISWNNGVFVRSADKRFSFHLGGTIHYDYAWYTATPILELGPGGTGPFHDGVNLRRARLLAEGTLYEAVDYRFEVELVNGTSPAGLDVPPSLATVSNSSVPTHAWMTIRDVPIVGSVRIGNQKEWFSLEHLNSHKVLEFLERSYLFDFSQPSAFNNGFTPGVSVFRTWLRDRVFSAVGVYKNMSNPFGVGVRDGEYAVTGRLAALPVWVPGERVFWHVGGAMSYRDPVNDQVQIRIRDNIRNAPFPLLPLVANTGLLNASSQDLFNFETAAVFGPLTFQAEYTANVVRGASVAAGPPLGDLFFQGYYAEALWLVTGESRTWNTENFFFNRVVPKRPLRLRRGDCCDGRGFGALEVGVRYSYIDLSNKAVWAGRLDSVTFGVNWYLNANAKIQFNYDYTHRGDTNNPAQGRVSAVGIRSAFDF